MRPRNVVTLVIGCLLVVPAAAVLLGGGALGIGYLLERGDDGFFDLTIDPVETPTVAVTTEDVAFTADPGSPAWLLDLLDADVRLRVSGAASADEVFVGIARTADLDAYLQGVGHAEVVDLTDGTGPVYRTRSGSNDVAPPTDQDFWVASTAGPGTQELVWEATSGRWAAVVMNADGTPGVSTDVNVGVRSGFVLPLALIMLGLGAAVTALGVALIVHGAARTDDAPSPHGAAQPPTATTAPRHLASGPVRITAELDPELSRWRWLVKWFLAIPHFIVLAFLWMAFVILTLVAGVAILFTGRYPQGIFDFNVGVLRWTWRVTYYASTGGIGTDHYPPFTLEPQPDDPARLDVTHPRRLSRGLVLVKWLLAIPHLVIVALLTGSSVRWLAADGDRWGFDPTGGGGLLGLLVLIAGVVLLFTGRYPTALFDLIVGFNRWVFRVVAYVALMTDEYPPFRLDQGGSESGPTPPRPPDDPPPVEAEPPAAREDGRGETWDPVTAR